MYFLYRSLTTAVSPLLVFWLRRRQKKGKEDSNRMAERFGYASLARPAGRLLWVHAASVGEANAALPLIKAALAAQPALHVLLTTGTVTSARLMTRKLPERAFHQFIPVDSPASVQRFMEHWKPDIGLLVDSELWPNLIMEASRQGVVLGLLNARMSERSFRAWQYLPALIRPLLQRFSLCIAQSEADKERLLTLGLKEVQQVGNIKYDVPPLACREEELQRLRQAIGERPVFLAASTHSGEEELILATHKNLQTAYADLLTVIVPRHAGRAGDILNLIDLPVAQRSREQPITGTTQIYLADTMGELGLFYRLARLALMGGSLVPHGGQNPIEALKLGCPVVLGPHMENFQAIVDGMRRDGACKALVDSAELTAAVSAMLANASLCQQMAQAGFRHVERNGGAIAVFLKYLTPLLAEQASPV